MITLAFIYRSYRRKIRDLAWTTFADWDKRVCVHDGRHMGHTFHPGASLCQPNYLPPFIRRCHRRLGSRGESSSELRGYGCIEE